MATVRTLLRTGIDDLLHPASGNIPALDVLRSLAILLVFTMHFAHWNHASPRVANFPVVNLGWTGVDLFFVLSGLLIGRQLWKELKQTGGIRIPRFLVRRGLRIWPLYFSFVALATITEIYVKVPIRTFYDAVFLSNYFDGGVGGAWSLSTEEQFYILAPVMLALFALVFRPKQIWIAPVIGIGLLVVSRALTIRYSGLTGYDLNQKLVYPFHTDADGLAVGLLLAWLSVFQAKRIAQPRYAAIIAAVMFVLGAGLYISSRLLFNFTAIGLLYGALVLYGISPLPLPKIFKLRGFYIISRLSFGVYLNHFVILSTVDSWIDPWRSQHGEFGFWAWYVAAFSLCLITAAFTFLLIEWPFLYLRAQLLKSTPLEAPRSLGQAEAEKPEVIARYRAG
jgi:peptidoglycan/LPS O-acetylase OafA/YrhL